MAFLETVRCWHEGIVAFKENRFQDTLQSFSQILEPSARILFNIACVQLRLDKPREGIVNLSNALKKDPHLAVGYFHRAVQNFKLGSYRDVYSDLDKAEQSLRGSSFINYSQLGLNFTLYKFEIHFNRAVCRAYEGNTREAVQILIEAGKVAEEEIHSRISVKTVQDLTIISQNNRKGSLPDSFKPFEISEECLFQPPKDMVANLGRKEYVAKSKVITGSSALSSAYIEPTIVRPSAPSTPPLPRRPLPPTPQAELKTAKSVGSLIDEMKKQDRQKIALGNDIENALIKIKSDSKPQKDSNGPKRPPRRPAPPSSHALKERNKSNNDVPPLPEKSSSSRKFHTPPPKPSIRSIPPPNRSFAESVPTFPPPKPPHNRDSIDSIPSFPPPKPPIKSIPSHNKVPDDPAPPLPSRASSTPRRNIPPPPSYKPPPPPPNFKAPPPPI